MPPSSTICLGSIQAAQYSKQVPDGDLLDLHLFPSERFPLSCFIQECCYYWVGEIQRQIHECTAINQAFLREVFVLGYQSTAVRGGSPCKKVRPLTALRSHSWWISGSAVCSSLQRVFIFFNYGMYWFDWKNLKILFGGKTFV